MPRTKKEMNESSKETVRYVLVDKVKLKRKQSDLDPEPMDVEKQAAELVRKEKLNYDESNRLIKATISRAYKNYLGIFDEPTDPYTNRRKIFTPLTHNIVDSVAKPVNVTSRSVKILPITAESRGAAKLCNMVLPYFFQQMDFDQIMKYLVHRVAWLGTQVSVQDWLFEEKEIPSKQDPTTKILEGFPKEEEESAKTKKVVSDRPRMRLVNVMDIFLPASAESIPWAIKNSSVILRSVVPLSQVQSNPAYSEDERANLTGFTVQTQDVNDSSNLDKYAQSGYQNEGRSSSGVASTTNSNPMVSVYTRFGKIPKSWLTKNEKDGLTLVDGMIECAGDSSDASNLKTLSIRLSPFGDYGPFEDCRYNVLPNRYAGEGLGERLIPLQAWQNEVVNNRRNNEVLVQHRMFLYRKGSVDTRQFFSRPGGGIAVENMADVQMLDIGDVKQSSFVEDQNIESSAMRLAGAATTPIQKKMTATESAGVQASANITYNELKDTVEKYIERLVLHHILPLMKNYFTEKRSIPINMRLDELEVLDTYNGYAPFQTKMLGDERFLMIDDTSIFDGEFSVTVDIDESGTSRPQQVSALTSMLALAAKIQNSGVNIKATFRKITELQGVHDDRLFDDAESAVPTGVTNPNKEQAPQPANGPAVGPMPINV